MPARVLDCLQPATAASIHLTDNGLSLTIDQAHYILVNRGVDPFHSPVHTHQDSPFFVLLPIPRGNSVSDSYLRDFRRTHLETDDIFQPVFLTRIVFYGAKETDVDLEPSAVSLLDSWETKQWHFTEIKEVFDKYAPGPYVAHQGVIWEPWRVYEDSNLAMTVSFLPQTTPDGESLHELDSTLTSNHIRMAVPSRCYSSAKRVSDKPLLGARIVVKDIFDIQGSKTSLCNRAWLDYYPPKAKTAPSIERLQALGAIIVGKTRLNAMIVREETMECVEFIAPFNPRGDGYQTSSGSSSGSCVALAAYPWLDFALGSDTNGSCRKPAYWMGCYAIRPTTGVIDTQGVASFCPFYDVPSFFGRDISRFKEFASLWYGDSPKLIKRVPSHATRRRILYLTDYLPTPNDAQSSLIESFIQDLEKLLGIERTELSLAEMWRNTAPEPINDIDLPVYLESAATMPYYKDACGILKSFADDYQAKFDKRPFFHKALRWRWGMADKLTLEERNQGWERICTYKQWLLQNVFKEGTIVILPIDEGKPNSRENPPPPFALVNGYHPLYMSPIAGTPEVSAPIGEISYDSEITGRKEPLPISVSVVTPPGTDLDLVDLVHDVLRAGGKPTEVATGRSILGEGGRPHQK